MHGVSRGARAFNTGQLYFGDESLPQLRGRVNAIKHPYRRPPRDPDISPAHIPPDIPRQFPMDSFPFFLHGVGLFRIPAAVWPIVAPRTVVMEAGNTVCSIFENMRSA